jgi:ABC-type sugar transport system ATPase subunit
LKRTSFFHQKWSIVISPVLELRGFSLSSQTSPNTAARCLLNSGSKLILPQPGIYTLEGDNQAGKSTLLKVLLGVLTPKGESPILKLEGESVTIRNIADAQKSGLAAVFQDDPLIPSLTVAEQLVLIHAGNKLQALTFFSDKNNGQRTASTPRAVLKGASKLLDGYGSSYRSILSKYPGQLSGGALAVARLIKAQLQKPLKLLFLDEAFSGVQRDVWPTIIDQLRAWSTTNQVTILAITHNHEELLRWQPLGRFVIREERIEMIAT